MLHHVSVGVPDVGEAAKFYDPVLGALGYKRVMEFLPYAIGYGDTAPAFWIQLPQDRKRASAGNGVHIGFVGTSEDAIRKFHRTALAHGGRDNGAPGPRPDYGPDYFGAFVRDPHGNKLEATLRAPRPRAGERTQRREERRVKRTAAKPARAERRKRRKST